MNSVEFNASINAQIKRSQDLLLKKNANYNPNDDKLATFKTAAALMDVTPESALAGMLVKHTVSVYGMIRQNLDAPAEVWNEKITDHINYLLLLRALVDERQQTNQNKFVLNIESV